MSFPSACAPAGKSSRRRSRRAGAAPQKRKTRILASQPALERTRSQLYSAVFSCVHCIRTRRVSTRCSEDAAQDRLHALRNAHFTTQALHWRYRTHGTEPTLGSILWRYGYPTTQALHQRHVVLEPRPQSLRRRIRISCAPTSAREDTRRSLFSSSHSALPCTTPSYRPDVGAFST